MTKNNYSNKFYDTAKTITSNARHISKVLSSIQLLFNYKKIGIKCFNAQVRNK